MASVSSVRQRKAAVLLKAQRGLCARCHLPVHSYGGKGPDVGTLDHVIPRAAGGSNYITNLLVMHRRCNDKKGSGPFKAHDFHAAVLRRLGLEQTQEPGPG